MIIIHNEKDEKISAFRHSQFKNDLKVREEFYRKKEKDKIHFYCDCQSTERAEIIIAKVNDTIYLKNKPKNGKKHRSSCRLHGEYQGSTQHEAGWTEIETVDGVELVVNPTEAMFKKETIKKENTTPSDEPQFYINRGPKLSTSRVTILGLLTRLNLMAWQDFSDSRIHLNRNPERLYEMLNQAYGTSRKIRIKRRKNLQDYWYSSKKVKELEENGYLYVYLPLKKIRRRKYPKSNNFIPNTLTIEMDLLYKNGGVQTVEIQCDTDLCEMAYYRGEKPQYQDKEDNGDYNVIVGGFIKKNRKFTEFVSIRFIPITNKGLWCESNNEKKAFEHWVDEGHLFYKGYEPPEYYGNYVPDAVFKKTLNPEREYVAEVFGVHGSPEYDMTKAHKIKLAEESEEFDLWHWDAPDGIMHPVYPE